MNDGNEQLEWYIDDIEQRCADLEKENDALRKKIADMEKKNSDEKWKDLS